MFGSAGKKNAKNNLSNRFMFLISLMDSEIMKIWMF